MGRGIVLGHEYRHVRGHDDADHQTHDILADGCYPLSGSFIDVSDCERFHVLILLGELADTFTFTLGESDSVSGTVDDIDATYAVHTCAANDDGEFIEFTVLVDELSDDHHFVTCTLSGVSGSNYATIVYLLDMNQKPVTLQSASTTTLPTASIHMEDGSN